MIRLLIIIFVLCNASLISEGCIQKNEEPRFCSADAVLFQPYCPLVQNLQRWHCYKMGSIGCGCINLYRAMDGKCVTQDKCEEHAKLQGVEATVESSVDVLTQYVVPSAGCGQTKQAVYCVGDRYIDQRQQLCPGVKPTICPRYQVWCRCANDFYRRNDGQCVRKEDCASIDTHSPAETPTEKSPAKVVDEYMYTSAGCQNTKRSVYCLGKLYIDHPRFLCQGVERRECPKLRAVCSCAKNLYRRYDGKCVTRENCVPGDMTTSEPQDTADIVVDPNVKTSEVLTKTIEFIQQSGTFLLLETSAMEWSVKPCECLESEFYNKTTTGSWRKVFCHRYVPESPLSAMHWSKHPQGRNFSLLGVPVQTSFSATLGDAVFLDLKPEFEDKRPGGSSPEGNPAEESNILYSRLRIHYYTLDVKQNCLLLGFGPLGNGKHKCMLWVTLNEDQTYNQEDYECHQTKKTKCGDDMINVWASECQTRYKFEKRVKKLAAEEI